jgi:hypothetical protein
MWLPRKQTRHSNGQFNDLTFVSFYLNRFSVLTIVVIVLVRPSLITAVFRHIVDANKMFVFGGDFHSFLVQKVRQEVLFKFLTDIRCK